MRKRDEAQQQWAAEHITPALQMALVELCREKPADPVSFLANALRRVRRHQRRLLPSAHDTAKHGDSDTKDAQLEDGRLEPTEQSRLLREVFATCREGVDHPPYGWDSPRIATDAPRFSDSLEAALRGVEAAPGCNSWVEWDDVPKHDGPYILSASLRGKVLASVSVGSAHMPLRIALPDAPHGESILLSLIWPRGCRHLHLAPRLSPSHLAFAFERTLAFPAEDDPVAKRASVDALARTLASLSAGGTVQHERGFGIELELLMPHGLDPELRSKSSFDTSGVAATIGATIGPHCAAADAAARQQVSGAHARRAEVVRQVARPGSHL